jgi:hypothetical protein
VQPARDVQSDFREDEVRFWRIMAALLFFLGLLFGVILQRTILSSPSAAQGELEAPRR